MKPRGRLLPVERWHMLMTTTDWTKVPSGEQDRARQLVRRTAENIIKELARFDQQVLAIETRVRQLGAWRQPAKKGEPA